jgi:hypothetical protein
MDGSVEGIKRFGDAAELVSQAGMLVPVGQGTRALVF